MNRLTTAALGLAIGLLGTTPGRAQDDALRRLITDKKDDPAAAREGGIL